MIAEIISVGTEILLGNIVNTNAAYLAEKLAALGLSNYFQTTVGDNAERLAFALQSAMDRSDIVLLSGGLGPTQDDLTKETVALVCQKPLILDAHSKERIEAYFAARGMAPTDNNWKQAYMPEGCLVLDNENGTAPGLILETPKAKVILLPGPPMELYPMFESKVQPYLQSLLPGVLYSKTVKICDVGESLAETMVRDLIDAQTNPTIATYAKTGEVHIRVTALAGDKKEAHALVKPVVKELKNRFGNNVYTTDAKVSLEQTIVELLLANNLTVTCAESCTGGLFSARLVNVPGASSVYKAGLITYSNKYKRRLLGVRKSTLNKYGAASAQTAEEMVRGAALLSGADVAVAITGIAGPEGGSEEKPVGLVYIACAVGGFNTVREYHFKGDRNKIRESAVSAALSLLRSCLLEDFSRNTFGE